MARVRLALLFASCLSTISCSRAAAPCAAGTLLVSLTLADSAVGADAFDVTVTADGIATHTSNKPHAPGVDAGTLQIDFPHGYVRGRVVTVSVAARLMGRLIGVGTATTTLPEGCGTLALAVTDPARARGERCDNGDDDDGDGKTDCEDTLACACLPDAPEGWQGPFNLYDGAGGLALPSCEDANLIEAYTGFHDLDAPVARCGACSCNAPLESHCQYGNLQAFAASDCSGAPTLAAALAVCTRTNLLGSSFRLPNWQLLGTCGAPSADPAVIPPSAWRGTLRACGASAMSKRGCGLSQVCVGRGGPAFESGRACVVHAGDLPCPAGAFAAKRIAYAAVDDTRGCSSCTCTLDGFCSAVLRVSYDGTCGAPIDSYSIPSSAAPLMCIPRTVPNSTVIEQAVSVGCRVTAPLPTGMAVPTSPTTVCCTP